MQKEVENFLKSDVIAFKTGGTTFSGTTVEKSFENLKREAEDIYNELKLPEGLEFITTTTQEHLFGFTFHYMLPRLYGYKINNKRVNYPEDINTENALLVTTPSFLDVMRKYGELPKINPKIIITAGAKLEDDTFAFAKSIALRVIEIYGSTETGAIGYRENSDELFKPFRGIKILETREDFTKISTEYSLKNPVLISDRIALANGKIEFAGRCGRVLKIQEKRVLADSIEDLITKSGFVEKAYCLEHRGKLAVLAVPNEECKSFLIKHGKLELVKRLKAIMHNKSEIVPQIWKFWDLIPCKTNGKTDKEAIGDLFCLNLSLPLVISRIIRENSAVFKLCFLKGSNFFKGHFDGYPVLPGVVQLFYANYFTKSAFGIDCSAGQIRKLKFSNIIRPAKILNLTLTKANNGIEFKYTDENITFSSGMLPLGNIYEGVE